MKQELVLAPAYIDGTCVEESQAPISLWDPIPIGVSQRREQVSISLAYRNLLVGGIPDAGKSAAMSMPLAAAALDATAELYLIDGKLLEFAVWEDCATGHAHEIDEAIELLGEVQKYMQERERDLYNTWKGGDPHRGRRQVRKGEYPLCMLCIDELATFTDDDDQKTAKEFTKRLRRLVSRGRATGIIVCAATQKPEGKTVDTGLRDLFAYRLAFTCRTPDASDTILGRGLAAAGYNAQNLPLDTPGLGYLLAEGRKPHRIRTYYLTDNDVRAYAAWARALRHK